ncbi:MAG: hypothetical protein RLZZ123_20 [Pseudomonadota bacterium]|jgi:sugar lactone lactonase YvrE
MGATATLYNPYGIAVDRSGHLYVADALNNRIRKISPAGVVSTLAGTGSSGAVNGSAATATFSNPSGLAVDSSGNVFVADYNGFQIRKINPAGVVSTWAGAAGFSGYVDGTGATARFSGPYGIAVDSSDHLYVADQGNHLIRKISPAGVVSTLAGVRESGGYVDGTSGTAKFNNPYGVAVDASGHVYVADSSNNRIRKITPSGVVSTYSGVGILGELNGTAWLATFSVPYGVCLDAAGNVYVADSSNHLIRKVSPDGAVSTLAGVVNEPGHLEGTGGTAKFNRPLGVAVDASGHVYVVDSDNHRIRKLSPY